MDESDKTAIKSGIIGLICSVPPNIVPVLAQAVSTIADYEYPKQWDTLLPSLVESCKGNSRGAALYVVHVLFKRWRNKFRSDGLFLEIKYSLGLFCQVYLDICKQASDGKEVFLKCNAD